MPAAAVIPAPPVYIYAAAVKKLVVDLRASRRSAKFGVNCRAALNGWFSLGALNRVS